MHADATRPAESGAVPTTVKAALRLAVKLAVDAGDFDRATALLGMLRGNANERHSAFRRVSSNVAKRET